MISGPREKRPPMSLPSRLPHLTRKKSPLRHQGPCPEWGEDCPIPIHHHLTSEISRKSVQKCTLSLAPKPRPGWSLKFYLPAKVRVSLLSQPAPSPSAGAEISDKWELG